MPSRILKESILDSPTLARLDEFVQDQFPRLLLLVDDWGCFNADPEAIKGRAYPKRKKVTSKIVEKILRGFHEGGMLFLWMQDERTYGYWVGWDAHNYCNASAVDDEGNQAKHRRKTPAPPLDQVNQYVEAFKNKLEQARTKSSIPIPIPIPKKESGAAEETGTKFPYGSHGNVKLTRTEHSKLVDKFGELGAMERVDAADLYFGSKGKGGQYPSHYLTILNWDRKNNKSKTGVTQFVRPSVEHDRRHYCDVCPRPHEFECSDPLCSLTKAVACPLALRHHVTPQVEARAP